MHMVYWLIITNNAHGILANNNNAHGILANNY